jgi:2-keto-myo-inositol isomerase
MRFAFKHAGNVLSRYKPKGRKSVLRVEFAINRTCLPHGQLDEFLRLAKSAGVSAVEIRNDIEGQEFSNGMPAHELKDRLDAEGLKVASVNALQRFNDWTAAREAEARYLIRYAAELGAPGLVLCPAHLPADNWDDVTKAAMLREGLRALQPIFADEGVTGYVEPLGMTHSTMKKQADAVSAIDDIKGWENFSLCYDTFQFFRCGDDRVFHNRIGLIHVSGIARDDLAPAELVEPDRGLVLEGDRVGNIDKLREAAAAGYRGFVSIEPFNTATQRDPDLAAKIRQSLAHIVSNL